MELKGIISDSVKIYPNHKNINNSGDSKQLAKSSGFLH